MRLPPVVKFVVGSLASLGLLLPPSAFAAAPAGAAPSPAGRAVSIRDAALGPQGTLRGRAVDPQGRGLASTRVVLAGPDGPIAETSTDAEGRFVLPNLQRGLYVVGAGQGVGVFRVWPDRVAPPSAQPEILIVSDGTLVRGQDGLYEWISEHFWLTSALIATAIAVPTALINTHRHHAASN